MKNLEKYLVPTIFILMFVALIIVNKRLDNIESEIQKIEQTKTK